MRRTTILFLLLATLALPLSPGLAAEKDPKAAGGQYVDVSAVAAPIVLGGQLINYIFVTVRLDLAGSVDAGKLREREPYFRDALVRAAHRRPFVKPGDYVHVDEAALKSSVMADAARIAGPGVVTRVEILNAQPMRITGLPKGAGPPTQRSPIP